LLGAKLMKKRLGEGPTMNNIWGKKKNMAYKRKKKGSEKECLARIRGEGRKRMSRWCKLKAE